MAVRLRRASLADAHALCELARDTFLETFDHYEASPLEAFLRAHYNADIFRADLSNPALSLWLAEDGDSLVGYMVIGPCKLPLASALSPSVELYRLYVRKSWHGKKLGARLMNQALDIAAAQSAAAMYLGVWERNVKAQDFYRRYGFNKIGEYDYLPIGEVVDREWIMEKQL